MNEDVIMEGRDENSCIYLGMFHVPYCVDKVAVTQIKC